MWLRFWWTRHPFHLQGHAVRWCYFCCGWGDDPRGGYECPFCYGQGFETYKPLDTCAKT